MLKPCTIFRFDSFDDVAFIEPMNRTGGDGEWLRKLCDLAESRNGDPFIVHQDLILIPTELYPIWEAAAFELGGTVRLSPIAVTEGYYGPCEEPIHIQKGGNGGYFWVPFGYLSPTRYLATINGRKKTKAKSEAARLNGKKGGRPKKEPVALDSYLELFQ